PAPHPGGAPEPRGARARGRTHVVLRDGGQLAVPRSLARRRLRIMGGGRRRPGIRTGQRGCADPARGRGGGAFAAAIRGDVDAPAWSIATPPDVYRALSDLPTALAVLVDAEALGED